MSAAREEVLRVLIRRQSRIDCSRHPRSKESSSKPSLGAYRSCQPRLEFGIGGNEGGRRAVMARGGPPTRRQGVKRQLLERATQPRSAVAAGPDDDDWHA